MVRHRAYTKVIARMPPASKKHTRLHSPANPGTDTSVHAAQKARLGTLVSVPMLAAHGAEEHRVGTGLAQLVQQQLHGLYGGKRSKHLAEDPHAVELVLGQEKLFLRHE